MADRDWEKELAKIDRQLGSMSDAELLAQTQAPVAPADTARVPAQPQKAGPVAAPTRAGMYTRLTLATLLAAAMVFWPYPRQCGPYLFAYLFACIGVTVAGVWSSVFTWKLRAARSHILSLAVAAWGIGLAAAEILPRVGYAATAPGATPTWFCE